MKKPVVLAILDGYGYNPNTYGNAIVGNSPNIDELKANNPNTLINASGMNVGLPDGQMGNSEVGHTNIGAGRIVYQELTRITKSILDGDFFTNSELLGAIENCKKNNSALHLMGLLSDGGVHSHNTHLYALVELAKKNNLSKVFVHCLMDGRDVSPTSGKDFVKELEQKLKEIGTGVVATVIGRYYAMDRDNRWDRVSKAYNAIAFGEGEKANSGAEAVANSYEKGSNDEFILPTVTVNAQDLKENDSFIFFNFRPDRAREITRAFVDDAFDGFQRRNGRIPLYYVCMTQYDSTMPNVHVAFTPQTLHNTFGEYLSNLGLKQLRIAETEKYAHVTFFFNGGVEKVYEGEDRVLIPSPKVATYDLQPEMSAFAVCDAVCERIESKQYDVIILNFANCDMVGHTGFFDAAAEAVRAVDKCMGRVSQAVKNMGGVLLITADHGNADKMYEEDGSPFTAHTTNPVPFIVAGFDCTLKEGGSLADIAPTMLHIMGIDQPKEMSGVSLIRN